MIERFKKILDQLRPSEQHAELEFLPAVLEVTETPPAPLGRIIIWTIVSFFTISVVWASIGKVDIVAVAQGKIVPSGRVKTIQPLEAGLVKNIFVKEGDIVTAGQALIELDSTISEADRQRQSNDLVILRLDRLRIQVLLESVKQAKTSNALTLQVPASWDEASEDLSQNDGAQFIRSNQHILKAQMPIQQQRLNKQHNEFLARAASSQEQMNQSIAERNAIDNRIQQLQATIPLVTERTEALKKVLDRGVVSRASWLEIEEQRITQVKELDIQKDKRVQTSAAIANVQAQQKALQAQFEMQWLTELSETESKIITLEQELIKTAQRHSLEKLVSPVNGTVQQLAIHTIGGVVTPAQVLMLIVPGEGALEIEAWVENKDIGFVRESQAVEIKVETFPFTKYGTINGEILTITNDAIAHEQLGLVYAAQVSMGKTTMDVNHKIVNLTPGMAVTVEVDIGRRRLIEYLISPLLRFKDESVKER